MRVSKIVFIYIFSSHFILLFSALLISCDNGSASKIFLNDELNFDETDQNELFDGKDDEDVTIVETKTLDCLKNSPLCPEIKIKGDPFQTILGYGPSPIRGYADPSIRKDPHSDKLLLFYSFVSVHVKSENEENIIDPGVSTHFAYSNDNGIAWELEEKIWTASPETFGESEGYSTHEVPSIANNEDGSWFAMNLRYHQPIGAEKRLAESFYFELVKSDTIENIGREEKFNIGGPFTSESIKIDLNLSNLSEETRECDLWTEPSLFVKDKTVFLAAECLVFDDQYKRVPEKEFIGLFAALTKNSLKEMAWKWIGKITDRNDAENLGAEILTQVEISLSKDGKTLLLVVPKLLTPEDLHLGCRVLELESLNPPKVKKRDGKPIVLAKITSSDSQGIGPGLCSYDPSSESGILFVRTELDKDLPEMIFHLHATGIHP